MKKLRLKNIKYLLMGHKVECACTVPGQLLIHHIHISWASLCLMNSVVFACLFAKNIYIYVCAYIYMFGEDSLPLCLYHPHLNIISESLLLFLILVLEILEWQIEQCWFRARKLFYFKGFWLITKVVNGKPWTRISEILGGGPWMSLFSYN